jgi:hypothetical protein
MKRRVFPKLILDAREDALIEVLQKEFEDFTQPGLVGRGFKKLTDVAGGLVAHVFRLTKSPRVSTHGWHCEQCQPKPRICKDNVSFDVLLGRDARFAIRAGKTSIFTKSNPSQLNRANRDDSSAATQHGF